MNKSIFCLTFTLLLSASTTWTMVYKNQTMQDLIKGLNMHQINRRFSTHGEELLRSIVRYSGENSALFIKKEPTLLKQTMIDSKTENNSKTDKLVHIREVLIRWSDSVLCLKKTSIKTSITEAEMAYAQAIKNCAIAEFFWQKFCFNSEELENMHALFLMTCDHLLKKPYTTIQVIKPSPFSVIHAIVNKKKKKKSTTFTSNKRRKK